MKPINELLQAIRSPKSVDQNTESESQDDNWSKSSEIQRKLKLLTCELAHLSDAAKLPYRKKGNA